MGTLLAKVLTNQIKNEPVGQRMYCYYAMDSILKRAGDAYVKLFEENILIHFTEDMVYLANSPKLKAYLLLMLKWEAHFSLQRLKMLIIDYHKQSDDFLINYLNDLDRSKIKHFYNENNISGMLLD